MAQLQKRIDGLLAFLQPHWDFVNCHMVNYLTDQHWNVYLPEALRKEIPGKEDVELAIEHLFWQGYESTNGFPEWKSFLAQGEQERLSHHPGLLITLEELIEGQENGAQLSIREFMSAKKCHEVG